MHCIEFLFHCQHNFDQISSYEVDDQCCSEIEGNSLIISQEDKYSLGLKDNQGFLIVFAASGYAFEKNTLFYTFGDKIHSRKQGRCKTFCIFASNAFVLLLHAACWWLSPQSPVMQSKLCGCEEYLRYSPFGSAHEKARSPMTIMPSLHQWP